MYKLEHHIVVRNVAAKSADKQCHTKTLQKMFKMSASLWNACLQPSSPVINNCLSMIACWMSVLDSGPTVDEMSLQLIDILHKLLTDPLL